MLKAFIRSCRSASLFLGVGLATWQSTIVVADIIDVKPGSGALEAALAQVKPGDVIRLEAGRYEGAWTIPGEITIEGAEPEGVIIVPTEFAAFRMDGANVVIRNLTFEHAGESRRAVSGEQPVRIENCRFTKFPEAIGLRMAPLADVVLCEFTDCEIAVRAIGGASPTVWGCRFKGGRIGVFAMEGAPYVFNNLFVDVETGLMLVAGDHPHGPVVRHNVLVKCKKGVEVKGSDSSFPNLSLRNSVFVRCDTAIEGPDALVTGITHCAFDGCEVIGIDLANRHCVEGELGFSLKDDSTVEIAKPDLLRGKGIRTGSEEEGTTHDIGLVSIVRPGVAGVAIEKAPRNRFSAEPFVVNTSAEEYMYMQLYRLQMRQQALVRGEHGMMDVQSVVTPDGTSRDIRFDINRCFGESAFLTP